MQRRELLLDCSIEKNKFSYSDRWRKNNDLCIASTEWESSWEIWRTTWKVTADDFDKPTKLQLWAWFIHGELKCAVTTKDEALNIEENLTVLQELHLVIGLDEAAKNRNERKVMQIL